MPLEEEEGGNIRMNRESRMNISMAPIPTRNLIGTHYLIVLVLCRHSVFESTGT